MSDIMLATRLTSGMSSYDLICPVRKPRPRGE